MSKSDVGLIGTYEGIFQDAARAYPALEKDLSKDMSSLRRSVEARGLRLITIDLVSCGKHFDRCLAQGQYVPSHLPLTKRASKGEQAPKFLRRLFLLVFDKNGRLKDDPDIQAIFFIRQIYLLGKKARYQCSQSAIDREVKKLIDHDASLPQPDVSWDTPEGDVYAPGFYQEAKGSHSDVADFRRRGCQSLLWILDKVSGILTSTLGAYAPSDWRFKHGPGAVSEGPRTSNKYCWKSWDSFLEREFPIADYGFHSYASWAGSVQYDELRGESLVASRLVAVPKTVDTPRLIAAEPASKQWCQQNLLDYFYSRTKSTWISKFVRFDDQTQNQALCISGSETGELCTIDLSAASDSVSCWFVGNLFRANPTLLRALRAVRTRHLSQKISSKSPEIICLRKYSMMGSAVTFPVESLGFLAICLSGVLHARGLAPTLKNILGITGVSVFGDDLVIPKDSWDSVTALLEACCFSVNTHKSFNEGNFRESCGVDSFRGVSITPAYWRGPYTEDPESILSLAELHNHLYKRWLMCTAERVRRGLDFPDCFIDSGAVGLHTRLPPVISGPVRYCRRHQVWKVLARTVTGHSKRLAFNDDCAIFQFFTEEPSPLTKWSSGSQSRTRLSTRVRWIPVHQLLKS
jgi:hypothetical protein